MPSFGIASYSCCAALGETGRVMALLEEALALPPDGSWTPARIALRDAALEFDAHGTPDAATTAVEYALDWLETRPADERETVDHRLRLCQALMLAGRDAEALEVARGLMAASEGSAAVPMYVGVISVRLGDRAEAERMDSVLQRMELPYDPGLVTLRRAQLAAQMGERDRAVTLLRSAFAEGLAYGPALHADPRLEPLRNHPPFEELLRPDG